MADLSKKEVALEWQEQSSGIINKGRVTLAAAVLAVGLSTSVQASDLLDNVLKQCDGIDRQWVIYKDKKNWIIDWFAEKQCKTKVEIAQKDASIAQKRAEIDKMDQILAMLDPRDAIKSLNDEIKKVETQLKTEKDDKKRKSLTYRLETLKTRLSDLDRKVA